MQSITSPTLTAPQLSVVANFDSQIDMVQINTDDFAYLGSKMLIKIGIE